MGGSRGLVFVGNTGDGHGRNGDWWCGDFERDEGARVGYCGASRSGMENRERKMAADDFLPRWWRQAVAVASSGD